MRSFNSIYQKGFFAVFMRIVILTCVKFILLPSSNDSFITFILFFFIFLFLHYIVNLIGKSSSEDLQNTLQAQRDKFPIQELEYLTSEEKNQLLHQDFNFFLRSFSTIQYLKIENPDNKAFYANIFKDIIPAYLSIEFVIARYLEIDRKKRKTKLFALGGDETEISAGRLFTPDENWQLYFELFAKKAKSIIIIPGYTESIVWEIEWLRLNNMFSKTIFIMPDCMSADSYNSKQVAYSWLKTEKILVSKGIDCPKFEVDGRMFKLDGNGKSEQIIPLCIDNQKEFIRNLTYLENGEEYREVEELKKYQYAIAALPIIILFFSIGILGIIIGLILRRMNINILKSQDEEHIKYLKIVGLMFITIFIYSIIYAIIYRLFNP